MIYVLNSKGEPLMPTGRQGKVRHLLKEHKAKVVSKCPFTIQLSKERSNVVQGVTLGIDPGYENVGVSCTTESKVLFEGKFKLRSDITGLLSDRRLLRRSRRNRKTRYRKPKFLNRKRSDKWLSPSVRSRVDSHLNIVAKVHKFLPVGKIVVELAQFDIQKIKNPDVKGVEYQQGEQLGFWNVREYILFRDGHKCRYCKGKSKDSILNVHHLESRQTGGNAPNNLITLCETCHKKYHKGLIKLDGIKRGKSFKAETFMGIMRNYFFNELKNRYNNVNFTYGYITKNTRIRNGLEKDHHIDARCISGNPSAKPNGVYLFKKVRCHNRQLHKCSTLKGGYRKLNQTPYEVFGYRLFDKVKLNGKIGFVWARRLTGSFRVRDIEYNSMSEGITYKKLELIEKRSGWIADYRQKL